MRAYLQFNIPEEQEDFDTCQNGWKYKAAMDELLNFLRSKTKYENKSTVSIEVLREKINEIKDGLGIID